MRSLLLALIAVAVAGAAAPASAADRLPLGPPSLDEVRVTRTIAPGVTHTRIVRGRPPASDAWTIDAAVLPTRGAARALAARLAGAGARTTLIRLRRPPDDPRRGALGFVVRTGRFETQLQADAERARLTAAGFTGLRTVFTGEDGRRTTGPWVVNVVSAPPARVTPALATDVVPGRELLSALAGRTGAVAAINGGYFVIGAENGTDGDLAGISVLRGALVSEAVDGRTSLVLQDGAASVDALRTTDTLVAADGARRELDGFNRAPGRIRACGGSGGDLPTEQPKHDFTCTDDSEVIRFTPAFGAATEPGAGAEAVLDAAGVVTELRAARGGPVPAGGSVLSATGDGAEWLRAHAPVGSAVAVQSVLTGERGPLALGAGTGIVNGGPRLVRGGAIDITASAEGFDWPEDPGFYYRFGIRRNPRTLAGVTGDGRLLLVTVDGRRPGYSVGASFIESARIMRSLGARDALNLDGGGSTGLTFGGVLATWPSDTTGERPIGDALLIGG